MIRKYIEERIGPVTDEEFKLSCAVVKNYILGELGGSARVELVRELMLHTSHKGEKLQVAGMERGIKKDQGELVNFNGAYKKYLSQLYHESEEEINENISLCSKD